MQKLALSLAIITYLLGTACTLPDDRTLIERIIRSSVDAAKDRDVSGMLARVADDFEGPRRIRKNELKRMLLGRLLKDQWLRIFERSLTVDIEVEGEAATAELRVVLARGNKVTQLEDLVPTDASSLRINLKLARRERRWWIVGADYREEPLTLDALRRP